MSTLLEVSLISSVKKKIGETFGDDSTAHHSGLQQLKDQPAVQALGAPVPLHVVSAYFYQVKV